MIGVDADIFQTDPTTDDVVLTSILKNMKVSTYEAIMSASSGDAFDFSPYVGTLENDGVGIAEFHNFADKVNPDLQGELDTVKAGIIDGSIPVTSYLSGS
jgi:basic membrane protein A